MPRISNIELLKTPVKPVLSIRTHSSVENLPMLIGQSFGRLGGYLASLGETLADVPFVAYHNMDMQNLDVEMGFPVASALPENGDIKYCPVPSGLRVFCMYQGAYSDMGPVYAEMNEWVVTHGYVPQGTVYEHYYNGPDCPEKELLTMIVMTVK